MPTYDYQCRSCGLITEVVHSMLEDGPTACERCGGELRRLVSPSGIIFKGSGFYKTDSRPVPSAGAPSGDARPASKTGDGGTPPAPGTGGSAGTGASAPSSGGEGGGASGGAGGGAGSG